MSLKKYQKYLAERDKEILSFLDKGNTETWIANKFSLSFDTISKIKKKYNYKKTNNHLLNKEALSSYHRVLGNHLIIYCIENDLSHQEMAMKLGLTSKRLSALMQGYGDFTLTELLIIKDFLGKPIDELIRLPENDRKF